MEGTKPRLTLMDNGTLQVADVKVCVCLTVSERRVSMERAWTERLSSGVGLVYNRRKNRLCD